VFLHLGKVFSCLISLTCSNRKSTLVLALCSQVSNSTLTTFLYETPTGTYNNYECRPYTWRSDCAFWSTRRTSSSPISLGRKWLFKSPFSNLILYTTTPQYHKVGDTNIYVSRGTAYWVRKLSKLWPSPSYFSYWTNTEGPPFKNGSTTWDKCFDPPFQEKIKPIYSYLIT
jgi:hypothetical protein